MTNRLSTAAAFLMFLSVALHVPILVLAFGTWGVQMLVAMVFWGLLGWGLLEDQRWVAWLAFLAALIGVCAALAGALGSFGLIAGFFWAILAVDLMAGITLFRLLWAAPLPKTLRT